SYLSPSQSVETVAKLASSRVASIDGEIVSTASHAVVGDNGGRDWIYHRAGRSGVTLGPFYAAGPGTADYFEARDKTVAYGPQFGCKADGVTDDRAALLAASNAEVDIVLPKGIYR